MIRCGGAAKGAKGGHVLWFVPARRMHANEKRPPFPNVNITHQAIRVCYRSKQSRLRPPRPPAQRREGLVSGAAVGHRRVQQMQDLAKCGMARRLQQVLIGRNKTSSRRKAAHWSVDYCSPTASKRSLAAPPPSFENRSSLSRVEKKIFCPPILRFYFDLIFSASPRLITRVFLFI